MRRRKMQGSDIQRAAGVTLVEALITLALVAILGALAVPAFSDMKLNAQRTAAVNDFLHAVFLARSEAIKRGAIVTLCRSQDGKRCADPDTPWAAGWIVVADSPGGQTEHGRPDESVIAVYGAWQGGTITSNRPLYAFRPTVQAMVNGTIVFCDKRGAQHARAIIISHTGRPRVAKRDSSGRPLPCPQ